MIELNEKQMRLVMIMACIMYGVGSMMMVMSVVKLVLEPGIAGILDFAVWVGLMVYATIIIWRRRHYLFTSKRS